MARKLRNNVRFPLDPPDKKDPFEFFSKIFGAMFGAAFVAWLISALASLALVIAIIYFLVKAAGTF
jgi:hypothetical protein